MEILVPKDELGYKDQEIIWVQFIGKVPRNFDFSDICCLEGYLKLSGAECLSHIVNRLWN